jgi:hypothetical protein
MSKIFSLIFWSSFFFGARLAGQDGGWEFCVGGREFVTYENSCNYIRCLGSKDTMYYWPEEWIMAFHQSRELCMWAHCSFHSQRNSWHVHCVVSCVKMTILSCWMDVDVIWLAHDTQAQHDVKIDKLFGKWAFLLQAQHQLQRREGSSFFVILLGAWRRRKRNTTRLDNCYWAPPCCAAWKNIYN